MTEASPTGPEHRLDRDRRMLQFLDQVPVAVFVIDAAGVHVYSNQASTQLLGIEPDVQLSADDMARAHPLFLAGTDDVDSSQRALIVRALAGESVYAQGAELARPDGTTVLVEMWASPITDEHGDVIYAAVVCNDIGDRRTREIALQTAEHEMTIKRQTEANLRALLDGAPDGIVVVDDDGVMRLVNRQTEALFGYDRDELLGQPIEMLVPDRVRGHHPTLRNAYRVDAEPRLMGTGFELRGRRRDGTEFPAEVALAPIQTVQGHFVSAAVRDVTVQHLARAEIRRANTAKDEFLSRMSHELRTPLNAILGFGQLLRMDSLEPDQIDSVDHIVAAGSHLLGLINEVLDLSTVESGSMRLSLEPVHARGVADEAIGMLRPLAEKRSIRIVLDESGLDVHVQADRQRLKQVVVNLLANAVKYNRYGGEVRVETEIREPGRLRVAVTDTGIGIEEADLGRLFQPFERLSAGQSLVEGTGLGLALTRHLVHAMGGDVGVTSRVGEGSTFWVELPLAESPAAHLLASPRPAPDADITAGIVPRTLLYVEDNLSNVRLLERVVSRLPGVTLIVAMQGRLALDLAFEHRPDLILLDLHLPDLSGEAVLRGLRDDPRTERTPVVILSADATIGGPARLLALGATDYLTKPFDIQKLIDTIDRLCSVPRSPTLSDPDPGHASGPTDRAATTSEAAPLLTIATIVHDFNNLLGVILSYCSLHVGPPGDAASSRDFAEIQVAAEQAVQLTKQLLLHAAPRGGSSA